MKIWVIEYRYTNLFGKTTWEFHSAYPMKHDAVAICETKNKIWALRQMYPEKNKLLFRVRLYKSQPGGVVK